MARKILPLTIKAVLIYAAFFFFSCEMRETRAAVLWTDRPEFVFYAEQFNASQDRYRVEVHYLESPAQKLTELPARASGAGGESPDMVAASWIKGSSTRAMFRTLDNLFSKDSGTWGFFYPRLLSLGKINNRQYLLPVSFNIPAMVFNSEYSDAMSNSFTISMEEIKELGMAYNIEANGGYTRMGFSPAWNDEFIFISATLFNVGFREASPIDWDPAVLEQAMIWIQNWIYEANTSFQAHDDFVFRYCYDPPAKLISSGRILFNFMNSHELFILAEEYRMNLDFRWISENDSIPLDEDAVYFGIHRRAKSGKAAQAFARWFFNTDTQRLLLENSSSKRILETSFGISGGFSAMRTVTEQIFPLYYPSLLGRMPPESFLIPHDILPHDWMAIKERVILPYLGERIRHTSADEIRSLERRISDWNRLNRN